LAGQHDHLAAANTSRDRYAGSILRQVWRVCAAPHN
jgi:hypothetical protein